MSTANLTSSWCQMAANEHNANMCNLFDECSPIFGLAGLKKYISQLQEGEAVDYTWTRMKTHKNQLRIRNSQVGATNLFGKTFFSIFNSSLSCSIIHSTRR